MPYCLAKLIDYIHIRVLIEFAGEEVRAFQQSLQVTRLLTPCIWFPTIPVDISHRTVSEVGHVVNSLAERRIVGKCVNPQLIWTKRLAKIEYISSFRFRM